MYFYTSVKTSVLRVDRDADSVVQKRLKPAVSRIFCFCFCGILASPSEVSQRILCRHAVAMHLLELQCCFYVHLLPYRREIQTTVTSHKLITQK